MGLCDRLKERICAEKRKYIFISKEEREEMHKFISEQLRKEYIRSLKLSQNGTSVFCREEEWKKRMVQDY